MSAWTRERHEEARSIGFGFSFYEPGITDLVAGAVTEIERLRPDLTGPVPEDRDEKVARFARRLWAAAIEVSEGDTTPIPAFEQIERLRALTTITDDMVEKAAHPEVNDEMVGRAHAAVVEHLSANAGCVYAEDEAPDMLRTALEAALNPKENEA